MKKIALSILFTIIVFSSLYSQESTSFLDVRGPYLGQEIPGNTPQLFAPGIVSTQHFEHSSPTISPNGKEIYWSRFDVPLSPASIHKVMFTQQINGRWTKPQLASFSGISSDDGPRFSKNGKRIYFTSRPHTGGNPPTILHDIFYVDRIKNTWSEPNKVSPMINSDVTEAGISFTKKGDMLFMRQVTKPKLKMSFHYSKKEGKTFGEPIPILNDAYSNQFLNITPFINKEGTIILFGSVNRSDGYGASDLYVSFKERGGTWSDPINLGDKINTPDNERFPSLSTDGNFIFFVSNRSTDENRGKQDVPQNGLGDVYWVNASILSDLRKNIAECKLASVVLEKEILNLSLEAAKIKYVESDDLSFNENKLNTLGYRFLQQNKIQEALFIFTINIQNFPNSANAYDSYAEALLKSGDKKAAIKMYQKVLEIDPTNENAKQQLFKLTQKTKKQISVHGK